jgi:starch synthase
MNLLVLAEGDSEVAAAGSGIPNSIVRHLRAQDHRVSTGDVDLRGLDKLAGAAISYSPSRQRWVVKYHLGAIPFALRSREARRCIASRRDLDAVIQWGATFSSAKSGVPYFLYCDANIHISRESAHSWAASLADREIESAMQREQQVYEGAAAIFTLSEKVRQSFIRDLSIPEEKVETVYAGHNLAENSIPTSSDLVARKPPANILFVGREFTRKGGDLLVRAFERVRQVMPNATLTIIGPKHLSISTAGVRCLGLLNKDDPHDFQTLTRAYDEACIFAFPTRFEPFGIVLVEAMFYGLPCVAPKVWAVPEIVQDGETGFLFDPESVEDLTRSLLTLLQNPELAARMGCAGRKRAEANFTWQRVTSKMAARIQAEIDRRSLVHEAVA